MNDALLGGYQHVRFLLCRGGDVTVTIYLCVSRAVAYYGSRSLGCQKVISLFHLPAHPPPTLPVCGHP